MTHASSVPVRAETARSQGGHPAWASSVALVALIGVAIAGGLGTFPATHSPSQALTAKVSATIAPPMNVHTPAAPTASSTAAASAAAAWQNGPKVTVSHLVVTYKDTPLGQHHKVTRTREEAKQRAEEALARARKGEDFGALVAEYSDEPGAKERKGRFANFTQRHAERNFGDAAFALAPGGLSDVVTTAFGFHVILREK